MGTPPIQEQISHQLALLDEDELAISARRAELFREIDTLYLQTPLSDEQVARLDELEELQRAVSEQRREIHERIDEIRGQIGLPPKSPATRDGRSRWQIEAH